MGSPTGLKYSKTHEWVKITDSGSALIGLTDHAQRLLSDIVYVNLCLPGDTFLAGESLGDVESIKAVSEILCPVDGTVAKVNEQVLETPELINTAPYDTWLVEMTVTGMENLLDPQEYDELIASEE